MLDEVPLLAGDVCLAAHGTRLGFELNIWVVSGFPQSRVILGLFGDNGKENGNNSNGLYRGYISVSYKPSKPQKPKS